MDRSLKKPPKNSYVLTMRNRPAKHLYHFLGSGLPNVYLANGYTIENDSEYGELVTIEKQTELMLTIAFRLAVKPDKLTGAEFRYLRKRMELSQSDLGTELRLNEQTIANYEKHSGAAGAADIAIRYLFLAHVSEDFELAQELRFEAEDLMKPSRRGRQEPPRAGPWVLSNGE